MTVSLSSLATPVFASTPSYGTTFNLSNDAGASSIPQVASSGSHVYVVWQDDTPGRPNIFFRASAHNGTGFGSAIILSSNTGWSVNPQIAASGSNVFVVWQDNSTGNYNILLRASSNNGTSFGPILPLFSVRLDSMMPQIAASGGSVYVVWQQTTSKNPQVYFTFSSNNGTSFQPAVNLSNDAGSALSPQVAVSANYVFVVWRDNSPGNDDVFLESSSNFGVSFGSPANLSNNPGESFNPKISVTGSDVYVVWADNTPGHYQVLFRGSTNYGVAFTPSLSQPALNVSNDPGIAIEPQVSSSGNNVYVAWRDSTTGNSQIFFKGSNDNGLSFPGAPLLNLSHDSGTAYNAHMGSAGANVYVGWSDTTPGVEQMFLANSMNSGGSFGNWTDLSNDQGFSLNPQVAASGLNVYVVWQDSAPGNYNIFFKAGTLGLIKPPFAYPESILTFENKPVIVQLSGSDPQGLALTFYVVSAPTHGTLSNLTSTGPSSAQVSYTPGLNFTGADAFTFRTNNGWTNSTIATVSVTVQAIFIVPAGAAAGGRLPLAV